MFTRVIAVSCGLLLWVATAPSWADDLGIAREKHRECQTLMESKRPCEAVTACRDGLAARPLPALVELLATAKTACASNPPAAKRPRRCATGQTRTKDTAGHCCWHGQVWLRGRCIGLPSACPVGFIANAATKTCLPKRVACADGLRFEADDAGHCCWAGQAWSTVQTRCVGAPVCPDFYAAAGEVCVLADTDGDGVHDRDEKHPACIVLKEDLDGHLDTDGCPDIDNDLDGVCDRSGEANMVGVFGVTCVGHDRCDGQVEDLDGFEDTDGCPDLDNDGDGRADVVDRCPNEAEDFDGFEDGDGCPEVGALPAPGPKLKPWAWASLGVGAAALLTGIGLHATAEVKRSDVTGADRVGGVVTSIGQAKAKANEALANDLSTAAVVSYGIAGALLATGTVLLLLDQGDSERAVVPGVSIGARGVQATLEGRF
jgi:hypothetical protein